MKIQLNKTNGLALKAEGLVLTMTTEDVNKLSGLHKDVDVATNKAWLNYVQYDMDFRMKIIIHNGPCRLV